MMTITDLNGCAIKITDLDKAVKQAKQFKDYSHADKGFEEFDKFRNAYWTDICNKLLALQQKTDK